MTGVFLPKHTEVLKARQLLFSPPGSAAESGRVDVVIGAIAGTLGLTPQGEEAISRLNSSAPLVSDQWERLLLTKLTAAKSELAAATREYDAAWAACSHACLSTTMDASPGTSGHDIQNKVRATLAAAILQVAQANSDEKHLQGCLQSYRLSIARAVVTPATMVVDQDATERPDVGETTTAVMTATPAVKVKHSFQPSAKKACAEVTGAARIAFGRAPTTATFAHENNNMATSDHQTPGHKRGHDTLPVEITDSSGDEANESASNAVAAASEDLDRSPSPIPVGEDDETAAANVTGFSATPSSAATVNREPRRSLRQALATNSTKGE